jgi:hypothetical protein
LWQVWQSAAFVKTSAACRSTKFALWNRRESWAAWQSAQILSAWHWAQFIAPLAATEPWRDEKLAG